MHARPPAAYGRALFFVLLFMGLNRWHPVHWQPIFLLLSLFHEFGHALGCLVTGGSVERFEMIGNGCGCAGSAGIPLVVAAAGPLASTVVGGAMLWVASRTRYDRFAAALLGAGLVLLTLLYVRAEAGQWAGLGFGGLLLLAGWKLGERVCDLLLSFLGFSSLFYTSVTGLAFLSPPSIHAIPDTKLLAELTPLSARSWDAVLAIVPLAVGLWVLRATLVRRPAAAP